MGNLVLRRATKEDMGDILKMQLDIFHGEQKIPPDLVYLFMEKEPQCWVAVLGNSIVGAVAAWKENGQAHWGRFVTKQNYRGLHIGTALAAFSFDDLFAQRIESIYMEARESAAKIVCKMGGKVVGKTVPFYESTVTPIVLQKKDFYKYKAEITP